MYDHIGLKVNDLAASIRFYSAALAPLGFTVCSQDDAGAGFGPLGQPAFWLSAGGPSKAAAGHVAFRAKERKAVDAFFAAGVAAGGKDNGAPGLRADYAPTYYAAFLRDPDGNNIEAVCTAA